MNIRAEHGEYILQNTIKFLKVQWVVEPVTPPLDTPVYCSMAEFAVI